MNNQTPLQALIDLISFDQRIYESQQAIGNEEKTILEIEKQLIALDQQLLDAQSDLNQAQKNVSAHELTMKELDQQEQEKTTQLQQVESDKEYRSIKKEIDFFKQEQHALEKTLMDSWNKLERAQKIFDEKAAIIKQNQQDLVAKRITHEELLAQAQQFAQELQQQRRPQEVGIPEEWLEKYNMIKQHNGQPLSYVVNDSCSSCFYPLTTQDIMDLNRKKLIQCRHCFRFLCRKEQ